MAWPQSQDYNEAIQNPGSSFGDAELRAGEAVVNALGMPMPRSGNFADVYEFHGASGQKWAVKCFTRQIPGLQERYSEISKHLLQAKLPFTVDFTYLAKGIRIRGDFYPVLKMHWVEGLLLNEFVRDNLDKPALLSALGQIWVRMATRLREANIAHADLQHGNVILVPGSKASSLAVKLIDYDGMWVPALAQKKSGELGHPAYQHPGRLQQGIYSAEVDRLPLLAIACALRCLAVGGRSLWAKYDNGDNLLFREADLRHPAASKLFKELWRVNDPAGHDLTGNLALGLTGALDQVPLLQDLLKGNRVRPLTALEETQVSGILGAVKRPDATRAAAAEIARGPAIAASFADLEEAVDSPGLSVNKKRRRAASSTEASLFPLKAVHFAIGGACLLLLVVVLGLVFATRGPKKPDDIEVTQRGDDRSKKDPAVNPRPKPAEQVKTNIPNKSKDASDPVQSPPKEEPAKTPDLIPGKEQSGLPSAKEIDIAKAVKNPPPGEGRIRHYPTGGPGRMTSVSPDGQMLAIAGPDQHLVVMDLNTGKERVLAESARQIHHATFVNNGTQVLAAAQPPKKELILFNVKGGIVKSTDFPDTNNVRWTFLALAPNERWALLGKADMKLIQWNVENWVSDGHLLREKGVPLDGGVSSDGAVAACSGVDPAPWLNVLNKNTRKSQWFTFDYPVTALAISTNIDFSIVGGPFHKLIVRQLATQAEREFGGHRAMILSIGISRDDKLAVVGDASGRVSIWDISAGKEIWRKVFPPSAERKLEFCNADRSLLITDDGVDIVDWAPSAQIAGGPDAARPGKVPEPALPTTTWDHVIQSTGVTLVDGALSLEPRSTVQTKKFYSGPLDIHAVARTHHQNIRIHAFNGSVIFNWELNPRQLRVHRPDNSLATAPAEPLRQGTWYRIHWRITEKGMTITVDDHLVFMEKADYDLSKEYPVLLLATDSKVEFKELTVKSLPPGAALDAAVPSRPELTVTSPAFLTPERRSANLLKDGSFEDSGNKKWLARRWNASNQKAEVLNVGDAKHGKRAAYLKTPVPDDVRLVQIVPVKPNTPYLLCGWIKTKDVSIMEQAGRIGANLSLDGIGGNNDGGPYEVSSSLVGTNDWTYQTLVFYSGKRTQVEVGARLGFFGSVVTGTAWFDDFCLIELPLESSSDQLAKGPGTPETKNPGPLSPPNVDKNVVRKKLAGKKDVDTLDLGGTEVTDAELKELAGLKSLIFLDLRSTKVTDAGLKELARLKSLRTLNLSNTQVTDAGLKELRGLTSLQLFGTQVTDAGIKELAGLKGLHELNLGSTRLTDAGLKDLAGFKTLQGLYLFGTQVTDAGLKELAGLKSLQSLSLQATRVTDAGLKELAGFKSLLSLDLLNAPVTAAGVMELRKAMPKCNIRH